MRRLSLWFGGRASAVALAWLAALAWTAAAAPVANAHPLSQGALEVTVHPDRVTVRARVTAEEVAVTNMLVPPVPGEPAGPASDAAELARHARYLAAHVHLSADGKPMTGTVVSLRPPGQPDAGAKAPAAGSATPPPQPDQHAIYELEYRLAGGPSSAPALGGAAAAAAAVVSPPAKIELRQDVLVGASYLPGVSWEASYVVTIRQQGGRAEEGLLLTSRGPVEFACDWSVAASANAAQQPATVNRWRVAREYVEHGVMHILEGYDHLLFVSALVLAAVTFWDLVKVVSAFTLAHTITLTLAALKIVHLEPWIVEPLISLSIVVVAAQNVFFPKRSRGWIRLAAAFFFGLFHGLGFAGGLLDSMTSMTDGTAFLLAIAAFSLGVEVGHQAVVIPLFVALKLIRRSRPDPVDKERVSLLVQRYASAAISIAGMVFLFKAIQTGGAE